MKTTEEKAKSYDEVVNKLRRFMEQGVDPLITRADVQDFFPELAESEDEKIRNGLVRLLKELLELGGVAEDEWDRNECEKYIAWLEKQGQVKESFISQHENKTCKENDDSLTSEDEKVRKALLELVHDTTGDELWVDYGVHKEEALAWLEKQEGCEYIKKDWLEHIKQSWYKEGLIDGKYSGGTSKEWTINDAATLKELIDFLENGTAKLQHDLTRYANWLKNQFTPIEKQGEQKPLGYVHHIDEDGYYTKEAILEPNPYTGTGFDYNGHHWGMCARDGGVEILMDGNITSRVFPDKNNIIEQKPTDSYCKENCKGFQETGKCFADGECKAKREAEQKTNKISIWSEEDERMFNSYCAAVAAADYYTLDDKQDIENWLQSLKDRVQPQPKQEWSDEDEQHIDSLLKRLDALCRNKFERTRFAISEDRDWLKFLRPQNTYNPYKAVVESIAEMCKHYDKASHSGLRDFYDNVKVKCKEAKEYDKMFPQTQWKPSDEQIKVCKEVYADILSAKGFDLGTVVSELNRLEEGLKKKGE